MRRSILAASLVLSLGAPALSTQGLSAQVLGAQAWASEPVAASDRAEIRRIIAAQIEAFRHDDGAAALRFAAPAIQRKFTDAAGFMSMVSQAYAPVAHARSFTFGALAQGEGGLTQKVELIGPDGMPALAVYDLEHEEDGSWKISGCRLQKSELQEI